MTEAWEQWEDPRRVLARHGERPSKRFSQNFLVTESVVERIAVAVAPTAGERVIEIGPGAAASQVRTLFNSPSSKTCTV